MRWTFVLAALLAACGPPGRAYLTTGSPPAAHGPPKKVPKRAATAPAKGGGRCSQLLPLIQRVAREHDVDSGLVVAIVRVESSFDPAARNGRSGATGLMQIMPGTGSYMSCGDLLDPEENLECGVRVLKRYLDRYEGNMAYGLAAYNAGPKYPDKAWSEGRLPSNFAYSEKVLRERARFIRKGCG